MKKNLGLENFLGFAQEKKMRLEKLLGLINKIFLGLKIFVVY